MSPTPSNQQPASSPAITRWSDTLHDQRHVLIRPMTRLDRDAERAFIEGLSDASRRNRFLGQVRRPSEQMIARLTDVDQVHDVAFVAVTTQDPPGEIVGVSRYATDPSGLGCECAVTVADAWQQKGLGTLLMNHLIDVARARGIRTMTSIDAADNLAMNELAHDLGFHSRIDPDDSTQVLHELAL